MAKYFYLFNKMDKLPNEVSMHILGYSKRKDYKNMKMVDRITNSQISYLEKNDMLYYDNNLTHEENIMYYNSNLLDIINFTKRNVGNKNMLHEIKKLHLKPKHTFVVINISIEDENPKFTIYGEQDDEIEERGINPEYEFGCYEIVLTKDKFKSLDFNNVPEYHPVLKKDISKAILKEIKTNYINVDEDESEEETVFSYGNSEDKKKDAVRDVMVKYKIGLIRMAKELISKGHST